MIEKLILVAKQVREDVKQVREEDAQNESTRWSTTLYQMLLTSSCLGQKANHSLLFLSLYCIVLIHVHRRHS